MKNRNESQVEAWFRYAEDLRLGPYYRDRLTEAAPQQQAPETNARTIAAAAGSHETSAVSAVPFPTKTGGNFGTAAAALAPSVSWPNLSAPSLFDERIENDSLERILKDIGPNCTRCKLHQARKQVVFGVGNPKAELVFVGEGPGRDEDEQGEPFVGRAGKLLTQMIEAMGLRREDVYICNVVKCRPPENRLPERDEIATCSPYLLRQLAVIGPKVICCLGSCSAQTLLQTNQGISRFRGQWFDFQGAKLLATYHPAYLLRNPEAKGEVWKDLQKVMAVLGLKPKRR